MGAAPTLSHFQTTPWMGQSCGCPQAASSSPGDERGQVRLRGCISLACRAAAGEGDGPEPGRKCQGAISGASPVVENPAAGRPKLILQE